MPHYLIATAHDNPVAYEAASPAQALRAWESDAGGTRAFREVVKPRTDSIRVAEVPPAHAAAHDGGSWPARSDWLGEWHYIDLEADT